ncbi:MAG: ABC transporter ATP-binding protein [Gammaproteobacteria bacterium]
MTRAILLSATNLSCRFNDREIIRGIDISLQAGDVLGLLGPNGVGKTTTLKMLVGVLAPHSGSITICDKDLAREPLEAKIELGYLPEEAPLYPDVTVNEYLDFCAAIRKVPPSARPAALEIAKNRCGLNDVGGRLIGNLSKGYKQRIGIAQAIIHNPSVLVLDEPTNGLDPNQIRDVRELVAELAASSQALIISTHLLSEVQALCNKVAILHDGAFAYQGSLEQQYQNIIVELDPSPTIEFFQALNGVAYVTSFDGERTVLNCEDRKSVTDAIVMHCAEHDISVIEIATGQSYLEQLFFDITCKRGKQLNV